MCYNKKRKRGKFFVVVDVFIYVYVHVFVYGKRCLDIVNVRLNFCLLNWHVICNEQKYVHMSIS